MKFRHTKAYSPTKGELVWLLLSYMESSGKTEIPSFPIPRREVVSKYEFEVEPHVGSETQTLRMKPITYKPPAAKAI